jgi:uncharacterized lipoprotein YbaY
MSLKRIVLAGVAFALLVGGPAVALAQQKATIQGRVQYLESSALPANATLWLTLEDATTGADLITLEKEGVVGGKPQPFPFTMEIEVSRVVTGARYRVVAEITNTEQSRSRLYWGASVPFTIATSGTTNVSQFPVRYLPGTLGETGSGAVWILIALGFTVLAGMIALWRRMRARPLVRRLA